MFLAEKTTIGDKMKKIDVISKHNDTYEVSAMYPEGRKNTDPFSCENDHIKCKKKCEAGIAMMKIMGRYEITGA